MKSLQFDYTLTEQEIFDGLRLSGIYKTSGKRALIESILLAVFAAIFLATYIWKQDVFSLVMAIVSLVLLALLFLVPTVDMKRQAKNCQRDVKLKLYAKSVFIETAEGSQTIALDSTSKRKAVGKKGAQLITVRPDTGGLLVIPLRAIPMDIRGQAVSILLQDDK